MPEDHPQNVINFLESIGVPNLQSKPIGFLVSTIIPYIYLAAGIMLLLYLLLGGFELMLSAGDPKKIQAGKSKITNAFIGFLIVFVSYWIVQVLGEIFGITAIIDIF